MRIVISGGDGRFAKELIRQNTEHELYPLPKSEMDITNYDSVDAALTKYKPEIFVHAAALSRPMNIHVNSPDISIQLNIIGTSNCVLACMKKNIPFVYISTDHVYPGTAGNYSEEDGVYPVNKYAWSKLGGECAAMLYNKALILRMGMMEYPFTHNRAFTDSYKSSIWHSDAAKILYKLIEKEVYGIYNLGGERKSVYDFVIQENSTILEASRKTVNEPVPGDISMNIEKLRSVLDDTTI